MLNSMYALLNDIDYNHLFYYPDFRLKLKKLIILIGEDNFVFLAAHLIEYNSLMIFRF